MKKNKLTQIFAILALFWIVVWIFGTGILFFAWWWASNQQKEITQDELQKMIKAWKIKVERTNTWVTTSTETFSWETNKIILTWATN